MWTCDFKLAVKGLEESPTAEMTCGSGLLLNVKGQAIAEAVFLCKSPNEYLFSLRESDVQPAYEALDKYLVADDVTLKILEGEELPYTHVIAVPDSPTLSDAALARRVPPVASKALDQVFFAKTHAWGLSIPRGLLGAKHEEYWVKNWDLLEWKTEEVADDEWTKKRLDAGVPEWGVDFGPNSLPLEFPLFHEISYHKGCYIGQEVIARATYRGHMTRGWIRVRAPESQILREDYLYVVGELEKPVGKLTTVLGNCGMGLLRFSALEGASPEQSKQLVQKLADGSGVISIFQVEKLLPEVVV